MAFQSRIGREPWLQPYTDVLLEQKYAQSGPRQLTVVCPGFAVDCLETLEEIDIRDRAAFFVRGGEDSTTCPASTRANHIRICSSSCCSAMRLAGPRSNFGANNTSCHDSAEPQPSVRP